MGSIWTSINWEHVGIFIISILSAFGVTFSWLKKMCSRIESTNLDVEAHKKEIQAIVAEMRELYQKLYDDVLDGLGLVIDLTP